MAHSKYKGVTFDKRRCTWLARIKIKGKTKNLGSFSNEDDAYQARLAGEIEYKDDYLSYTKGKDDYKSKLLKDYQDGMTQKELAYKYSKDASSINELLHKSGIEIRDDKTIDLDMSQVKKLYLEDKKSSEDIAKMFDVCHTTILNKLHDNGVKVRDRIYELVDEHFLKAIDEPWKAYYIGLLWADGNMRNHEKHGSYHIRISLTQHDNLVLKQLSDKIYNDRHIIHVKGYEFISSTTGKISVAKPSSKLEISSKIIHEDLVNLGCHPAKSHTIEYPKNFPDDMFWHFLRGYFDGDGWITKGGQTWGIIGSGVFCLEIQKRLEQYGVIDSYIHKVKGCDIYRLLVHRKKYKKIIFDNMYKDVDIKMQRKYDVFNNFISNHLNSVSM